MYAVTSVDFRRCRQACDMQRAPEIQGPTYVLSMHRSRKTFNKKSMFGLSQILTRIVREFRVAGGMACNARTKYLDRGATHCSSRRANNGLRGQTLLSPRFDPISLRNSEVSVPPMDPISGGFPRKIDYAKSSPRRVEGFPQRSFRT